LNRRGFISLLAGSAGAVLVPWRAQSAPCIFLPPRSKLSVGPNGTYLYGSGPTHTFFQHILNGWTGEQHRHWVETGEEP
jgi:hypothetical protein